MEMCLGLIELCLCVCVSLANACVVSVLTVSVGPLGIFCCCQLGFLPHSKITVCTFSHLFVNVCVTCAKLIHCITVGLQIHSALFTLLPQNSSKKHKPNDFYL